MGLICAVQTADILGGIFCLVGVLSVVRIRATGLEFRQSPFGHGNQGLSQAGPCNGDLLQGSGSVFMNLQDSQDFQTSGFWRGPGLWWVLSRGSLPFP